MQGHKYSYLGASVYFKKTESGIKLFYNDYESEKVKNAGKFKPRKYQNKGVM